MTIACFDAIDSAEFTELCSDEVCRWRSARSFGARSLAFQQPRVVSIAVVGGVDIVSARRVLRESGYG